MLRGSEAPRPGRVPYSYLVLPDAEDAGGHVRRLDARQGVGVAAVDEDDELDLAHRAVGDADVRDAQVLRESGREWECSEDDEVYGGGVCVGGGVWGCGDVGMWGV